MNPAPAAAAKNTKNVVGGNALSTLIEKDFEEAVKRVAKIKEYL